MGRIKVTLVASGERNGRFSYIQAEKRKIELHPGREKKNSVASREENGK